MAEKKKGGGTTAARPGHVFVVALTDRERIGGAIRLLSTGRTPTLQFRKAITFETEQAAIRLLEKLNEGIAGYRRSYHSDPRYLHTVVEAPIPPPRKPKPEPIAQPILPLDFGD